MSITASFSNALSGMTAAALRAQTVSTNIANALTDGYGHRSVEVAARQTSGGVQVLGITRAADPVLTADRRVAEAALGEASVRTDSLASIERAIGTPDTAGSLTDLINRFETALIDAASRPDSETRLERVRLTADDLVDGINTAATQVQEVRTRAERSITGDVETLNVSLALVDNLNRDIARGTTAGRDVSALLDQRDVAVDQISELIPVREVPRNHGQVALMSLSGTMLLDGVLKQFSYDPAPVVTPFQSIEAGTLGELMLEGEPISVPDKFAGGRLAGIFAVRDEIAPEAQADLDGLARDLVERFADPTVDTTRAATDPGLFTDDGNAFDPLDETGLAQRVSLNAAIDPNQGGALFRIRDGLAAATPGPEGDPSLINRLADAITTSTPPTSTALSGAAQSLGGLSAEILSGVAMTRQFEEANRAESGARTSALLTLERQTAVDTDAELQDLLLIEQAYAANARVIQTVDEMIQRVLEI